MQINATSLMQSQQKENSNDKNIRGKPTSLFPGKTGNEEFTRK